jgi:recombination protein RecA
MADMDELMDMLSDVGDGSGADLEPAQEPTKSKGGKKAAKKEKADPQSSLATWWGNWGKMATGGTKESFEQLAETPLLPLDIALGHGGVPLGGIWTIYGFEGTGKTTLVQVMVAAIQKKYPKKIVIWVDGEGGFDGPTAERNGIYMDNAVFDADDFNPSMLESLDRLLIHLTPTLENGFSYEKMMVMAESLLIANSTGGRPAPDGIVLVCDSLDSINTQSEIALEADDGGVKYGAGAAKANSVVLKRIAGLIKVTNSIMIITQQGRDDVTGGPSYGPPKPVTSGGRAVKNYSKVRLWLRRGKQITRGSDESTEIIGHEIVMLAEKNKYHRPFVKATLELRYNYDDNFAAGYDRAAGLLDMGIDLGLIIRPPSSGMHNFVDMVKADGKPAIFNGRENARKWLIGNPQAADELEDKIRTTLYGLE